MTTVAHPRETRPYDPADISSRRFWSQTAAEREPPQIGQLAVRVGVARDQELHLPESACPASNPKPTRYVEGVEPRSPLPPAVRDP